MTEFEGIVPALGQALIKRGYAELTSVQKAVLAPELADADALVSAQTGSGKTVAFGLALAPTLLGGEEKFARAGAPLALVITAEYERISQRYGDRAARYVHMEVGHAAQNVYLQAEALGLGTVVVGSFQDEAVSQALSLPAQHRPLYIMPVGHSAAT